MKLSVAQALFGLAVTAATGLVSAAPAAPQATPDPILSARRSTTDADSYEVVLRRQENSGARIDPLLTFCGRFKASCLDTCMASAPVGKTQSVTYACRADQYGEVFTMGCKCGSTDRTGQVLNLLGGMTTSTKITSTSTRTIKTTTKPTVTTTTRTTSTSKSTYINSKNTTRTSSTTKVSSRQALQRRFILTSACSFRPRATLPPPRTWC